MPTAPGMVVVDTYRSLPSARSMERVSLSSVAVRLSRSHVRVKPKASAVSRRGTQVTSSFVVSPDLLYEIFAGDALFLYLPQQEPQPDGLHQPEQDSFLQQLRTM